MKLPEDFFEKTRHPRISSAVAALEQAKDDFYSEAETVQEGCEHLTCVEADSRFTGHYKERVCVVCGVHAGSGTLSRFYTGPLSDEEPRRMVLPVDYDTLRKLRIDPC